MDHLSIVEMAASMIGFSGLVVKTGVGFGSDPVPVINKQVCAMTRLSFVVALLWFYYYSRTHNMLSTRCIFSLLNLGVAVFLLHKVHQKEKAQSEIKGYSESTN